MKAIQLHEYGNYENLKYEEDVAIPVLSAEQILVKVAATTVNHLDIKKASGAMKERMPLEFPWIPGHDFAGVVQSVGENVTTFKKGDKVYGNSNGGSYAEYLAADVDKTVKMPDNLTFNDAATIPHVGETAWQAIHENGKLQVGEKVLIHGGAGAVGAFAVQFARQIGATVYATASAKDIERVKAYGADEVIDYRTQDFTQLFHDVDLVLSLVGGDTEIKSYKVLKKGGRLVSTVGLQNEEQAKQKNITAIAMVIRQSAEDLEEITQLVKSGKLKTDVGMVYELKDAADGWVMLSGADPALPKISHGKIVLQICPDVDMNDPVDTPQNN